MNEYNDEDIFELLTEQLGREPTDKEILDKIESIQDHWFDMIESELGGN